MFVPKLKEQLKDQASASIIFYMRDGLRICKRCLLREQPGEEYFQKLENYIANLEEEDRVSQEVYEKRLEICGKCEYLMQGMCRLCGCFVELRASLRVRKCASVPAKWKACPDGKTTDPI